MYRFVSSFYPQTSVILTLVLSTAQSYVMMHMSAVIASAAMLMDWTHEKTADSTLFLALSSTQY